MDFFFISRTFCNYENDDEDEQQEAILPDAASEFSQEERYTIFIFSCSNVRSDVCILFVYSLLDDDLEDVSPCLSVASCSASLPSRSSSQPPPNQTPPSHTPTSHTPTSHTSTSHTTNTRKRQRQSDRDGDGALLECLSSIETRRQERQKAKDMDPDTHFAMDIAARLRRLSPRDNAIAKMKLLEVLTNIEFPPEQYTHASNYTGPNYYGTNFS